MRAVVVCVLVALVGAAPRDRDYELTQLKEKLRSVDFVLKGMQASLRELERSPELEHSPEQKRGISAEEDSDADFKVFFEGLSPEQQAVVKKFPSKWQQLKAAVHAPPGEEQEAGAERRELAGGLEAEEAEDADFKAFVDSLPPDQQEVVKRHPSSWKKLRAAVHTEPGVDVPEPGAERRELAGGLEAEEAEDADFKAFVDSLPPDQQEVIKRHPSSWKKLRAAVHTEPGVDVPAPEEAPDKREEVQQAQEEMPAALKRFYDGLSDDKKELLRRHPSQWGRISETLQNPGGQDTKDTDAPDKRVYESELKDFVSELSADDKQLLTKLKAKLKALREQVEAKRQHDQAAHEVKARFLGDMRYARQQGVSIRQLLQLLMRAKNKA